MEEEKKRESRSFQVSQDVLRHLHVPDKLEILNMARYHSSWTDAMREASKNRPIILRSMAFLLAGEHHRSFLNLVPTLQTAPLLGLTRTTDCRRQSLLRTSALRPEMTALREMARLLADVCNYCVVVVDTTSELV